MTMALERFPVGLVVLMCLWTFTRADTEVLCDVAQSCILPCSYRPGAELVLHWVYIKRDAPVHSFYHNKDQLGFQDMQFQSRTSLFSTQISSGNSSLRLTGVTVKDEGRYKCYTSTITENVESFINLKVNAPVNKVNIQQRENSITCFAEGIYPEPELIWSTTPQSEVTPTTSNVQLPEDKLYNIRSSLSLPGSRDVDYSCTIRTQTSSRTATLFKQTSITGSDIETIIPCSPSSSHHSGLVWTYNHSQIILTQSSAESSYSATEQWRQHVKAVSESGSLTLAGLSSSQDGVYTCELSDDTEIRISNNFVRFIIAEKSTAGIIAGVLVAVLILLGLIVGLLVWRKKVCNRTNSRWYREAPTTDKSGPTKNSSTGH